jgi:hypothetical protein
MPAVSQGGSGTGKISETGSSGGDNKTVMASQLMEFRGKVDLIYIDLPL